MRYLKDKCNLIWSKYPNLNLFCFKKSPDICTVLTLSSRRGQGEEIKNFHTTPMSDTIKKHLFNAYLSLAIVSIFWGTTYYAIHVGVQCTSGFALAGLRQAIAGLLLAGYFVLRGHRLPDL